MEYWPGDVRIVGAEVGEAVERDVGLDREGEVMFLGEGEGAKEGTVGAHGAGEERGDVCGLGVFGGSGVGDGSVVCVPDCEVLSYSEDSISRE